jgi:cephalosporin-C deacetylase-like acetyl esterase
MTTKIPNVSHDSWGRREWLQFLTGAAAVSCTSPAIRLHGQEKGPKHEPLNRFPRMVHNWFIEQVREKEQENLRRLDALETQADAERYVQSVREKIRSSFGAEPKRTPLNARVTQTIDRGKYRIENIIFESRPNFPVTANLYLPNGSDTPVPGVIGTCGHSSNGKAEKAYQSFAQGLARLGTACLIYDPIGQGERLQYVNDDLSARIGPGTREHLKAGNQQFLVGEFLGSWRAWDGIRALDYLLSRKEIDSKHVGVTGNSGGGTMTTWLSGVERRWTMSAPSCFVTTFRHNLENELPADTEQCPPRALALGLDHSDFLAAMAPHPVIILAKERDYFDVRGSEETYRRLRKLYRLLGVEDNVALFVGPSGHGYSQENREAMYSWFDRAAGGDRKESERATVIPDEILQGALTTTAKLATIVEPELAMEADATLQCSPRGQVAGIAGTKTVFQFTRETSVQFAEQRKQRKPLTDSELRTAVRRALKLSLPGEKAPPPHFRVWRYLGSRDFPSPHAVGYTVETEPGVAAIVYRLTSERWHSRPPQAGKRCLLYVADRSSDAELREEPLLRELISQDAELPVFTCDVRGTGESQPATAQPGSFDSAYGTDYFYAIHSLMLDRPYVGQKTLDLLRVLQWLKSLGHTEVHLVGRGRGAVVATFAALFANNVAQVTLKNSLDSYASIAESEDYEWPLSTFVPKVLASFDLPDCYRLLESKELKRVM